MTTAASIAVVTVCTPGRAEHLRSQRRAMAAHLPGARHVVVLPDRPGGRDLAAEHPELLRDTFNRCNQAQGAQQKALAASVGAVNDRVYGPTTVVADVIRAFRTAVTQRRTVMLHVAIDIAAAAADFEGPVELSAEPPRPRPEARSATRLAELLRAARRPMFVSGRGARCAGPEIAALAEAAGALVATSAVANGLFAGNPFSLGISGGFSSPTTAELIADADLIVGWGCALNMWTMRHGRLIGTDTTVVQVDLDIDAIGAHRPIDLGVVGDCGATATDVHTILAADGGTTGYRTEEVRERISVSSRWQDVPVTGEVTAGRVDPRALTIALDEILPADRVVSIDSGNFMGYPSTHLSVPDEFGFCFTQAFQSIGLGLGTAIGAAFARPDRVPVVGTGDGAVSVTGIQPFGKPRMSALDFHRGHGDIDFDLEETP